MPRTRAPISVIIPTLNAETVLPVALNALFEGLSAGLIRSLVISDGGSRDRTLDIAEEAGARIVTGAPSRGGQLRRGVAAAADAEWLLVLHADTVLPPRWSDEVDGVLDAPGAWYWRLRFDAEGLAPRAVAAWANLRSRLFNLPYGDQGLLIDRATYEAAGGYRDIPLMEDVALARKLGRSLRPLQGVATTSAEKYRSQGWLRRGGRNLSTLTGYLAGCDPESLAARYRR